MRWARAVFQGDNQKVYALGLLRAPHLRMVGDVVDGAALVTQTRSTATFGDNTEFDVGELTKSPDYIRAYGSCSQRATDFISMLITPYRLQISAAGRSGIYSAQAVLLIALKLTIHYIL